MRICGEPSERGGNVFLAVLQTWSCGWTFYPNYFPANAHGVLESKGPLRPQEACDVASVCCVLKLGMRKTGAEREREGAKLWQIFFFCSKMSRLPPTSLVAYKNRVIVFICVFTLPYLEIAVINQYEAGSRDLSRSRDQSCDLSVSSFSSNTFWKGISRTSSICFPCFSNDSKKPKRIIKELHILPYLRTKQYAGWVYRRFRRLNFWTDLNIVHF